MPRRPRQDLIAPFTLYHIVSRGNNQRRIFRAERDYSKFLSLLCQTKKLYPFYLYSFSLLPNHYHLALETKESSISKIMHQINSSYAKYFRHRYKGSGHLFEGRFYSSVIDKDSYLWELGCYIDLNPVRAGLVKKPEDYKWSSYLVYFQGKEKDGLLDWQKFLQYLNNDLNKARIAYLNFVRDKLQDEKGPKFKITSKFI